MNDLPYFLSRERLEELAAAHAGTYQAAKPFSHIVIDDFLPPEVLERVLTEFPGPNDIEWSGYKKAAESDKITCENYWLIPPYTRFVLDQLNTSPFVEFLEKLSGMEGLIPDPHYRGGGLHQTIPGGWLGVHVDFNRYKRLKLYRRINVLVYLNKDWKDEYGGHLELWDRDMKECLEKVAPIFNRCVIFTTSEDSHHGHPDPLTCPPGMTRKSLAWYYYTSDAPPTIDKNPHTTVFKERPGEHFTRPFKEVLRDFIPPIVSKTFRRHR